MLSFQVEYLKIQKLLNLNIENWALNIEHSYLVCQDQPYFD